MVGLLFATIDKIKHEKKKTMPSPSNMQEVTQLKINNNTPKPKGIIRRIDGAKEFSSCCGVPEFDSNE
jgi:hypothetical protein